MIENRGPTKESDSKIWKWKIEHFQVEVRSRIRAPIKHAETNPVILRRDSKSWTKNTKCRPEGSGVQAQKLINNWKSLAQMGGGNSAQNQTGKERAGGATWSPKIGND